MASLVMLYMVYGQIREAEPAVAVLATLGALGLALLATKVGKRTNVVERITAPPLLTPFFHSQRLPKLP